ncbi:MAG: hypothetical protein AB7Q17_02705 [Phycisphaerae bacterium]
MEKSNHSSRREKPATETTANTTSTWTGDDTGSDARPRTAGRSGSNAGAARSGTPTESGTVRAASAALDDGLATLPPKMVETFVDERDDVLAVINELENELDRYQEIRNTLERELADSNEKLQTATQRAQELEWSAVTLQTRVDALEQVKCEIGTLEEQLNEANARAVRAGEDIARADKEIQRLEGELKAANKSLEELWAVRRERDGLKTDNRAMRTKLDEFERAQREWLEERAQSQSRIQEAQLAYEEVRTVRHQLDQELRTATERANEIQRANKAYEEKLDSARSEKKNLQAQIAHLERENSRLIEQRQFYEGELTALRNTNRQSETALASIKKAFAEVRVALSETRTRARRRSADTWPRIGSTLREIDGGVTDAASIDADALPRAGLSYGDLPANAPRATQHEILPEV